MCGRGWTGVKRAMAIAVTPCASVRVSLWHCWHACVCRRSRESAERPVAQRTEPVASAVECRVVVSIAHRCGTSCVRGETNAEVCLWSGVVSVRRECNIGDLRFATLHSTLIDMNKTGCTTNRMYRLQSRPAYGR